jgi:hypothetical protein
VQIRPGVIHNLRRAAPGRHAPLDETPLMPVIVEVEGDAFAEIGIRRGLEMHVEVRLVAAA